MYRRRLVSEVFRIWVRVHGRSLPLSELKATWREVRRFVEEHVETSSR